MSLPHICTIEYDTSYTYLPQLPEHPNIFQRLKRKIREWTVISKNDPQCTEYFRSVTGYRNERKRHVTSNYSYMIHPMSKLNFMAEMLLIVTYIMGFIYFPLQCAFHLNANDEKWESVLVSCVTSIFTGEIILRCFTGAMKSDTKEIILEQPKVVRLYVFSWYFISDVLGVIPVEIITSLHPGFPSYLVYLRLAKLVRIITFLQYSTNLEERFNFNSLSKILVRFFLVTIFILHWTTCLHFILPQARFYRKGYFNEISWLHDLRNGLDKIEQYLIFMNRSAGILLCTRSPSNINLPIEEQWLMIIIFVIGKIYFLAVAVILVNFVLSSFSLETKYQQILTQLHEYMKNKKLPLATRERLMMYYDHKYQGRFVKESIITNILSDKLKKEINAHACQNIMLRMQLFADVPSSVMSELLNHLKTEVYLPNDIIIQSGSREDCMYFLSTGTVVCYTPSGKEICHLEDGAYFGETCLIMKEQTRLLNVVALEVCEIYRLESKPFNRCFRNNKNFLQKLQRSAVGWIKKTRELEERFKEEMFQKTYMHSSSKDRKATFMEERAAHIRMKMNKPQSKEGGSLEHHRVGSF